MRSHSGLDTASAKHPRWSPSSYEVESTQSAEVNKNNKGLAFFFLFLKEIGAS